MLAFASAGLLSCPVLENSLAHASAGSDAEQSEVVLVKVSKPVYPLLARHTRDGALNLR
jgi:hypothetical protein